jgi:hypothetical protein
MKIIYTHERPLHDIGTYRTVRSNKSDNSIPKCRDVEAAVKKGRCMRAPRILGCAGHVQPQYQCMRALGPVHTCPDVMVTSYLNISGSFRSRPHVSRCDGHVLPQYQWELFRFFFGCRKCDFPLRHRGLRIAQFS